MTQTTKEQEFNHALSIDTDALNVVKEILQDFSSDLLWVVFLTDKSKITCSSLDEVLAIPNAGSRLIRSLYVSTVTPIDPLKLETALIGFTNSSPGTSTMNYEVKGADKEVVFLTDSLREFALGQRQWYWYSNSLWGTVASLSLLALPFNILLGIFVSRLTSNLPAIIIMLCITSAITGSLLTTFYKRFFPSVAFLLGKGIDAERSRQVVRTTVLGALAVAIIGALIASFLYDAVKPEPSKPNSVTASKARPLVPPQIKGAH